MREDGPLQRVQSVAVIVPTYRRQASLDALLGSIFAGTQIPEEVIVVDNDPLASCKPAWPDKWPIQLIQAGLGLNLAGARNRGWLASRADLCIFVDDDNTVAAGTVMSLAAAARDATVGLLAPVIYEAEHPERIWCAGVKRSMWTTRTTFLSRGLSQLPALDSWSTDEMPDAFAVPRLILEQIGGFDEVRFPFYYDEADLGQRIRHLGLQKLVVRVASTFHRVGAYDPGLEYVRAFELNGRRRIELMVRSRVAFHRLYSSRLEKLVALGIFIPIYGLVLASACLRTPGRLASKTAVVRAIASGVLEGYLQDLKAPAGRAGNR